MQPTGILLNIAGLDIRIYFLYMDELIPQTVQLWFRYRPTVCRLYCSANEMVLLSA